MAPGSGYPKSPTSLDSGSLPAVFRSAALGRRRPALRDRIPRNYGSGPAKKTIEGRRTVSATAGSRPRIKCSRTIRRFGALLRVTHVCKRLNCAESRQITVELFGRLHCQRVVEYLLAARIDLPFDRLSALGTEFMRFHSCERNEKQLGLAAAQKLSAQCHWNNPVEILSA